MVWKASEVAKPAPALGASSAASASTARPSRDVVRAKVCEAPAATAADVSTTDGTAALAPRRRTSELPSATLRMRVAGRTASSIRLAVWPAASPGIGWVCTPLEPTECSSSLVPVPSTIAT